MTIRLVKSKDNKWNADKTIYVYVDGVKQNWFLWGMSLKKAYPIAKKTIGVTRAKKEFEYA